MHGEEPMAQGRSSEPLPAPEELLHSARTLASDVSQAVGLTPIVRLNRLGPLCRSHELLMKLESCNPAGSIKDKNAAYMIRAAENSGQLKPGGVIVESSSGNFGIGLAMIGAARGYRVIIVVDAKTPPPMRRMLRAYGAELAEVPMGQADEHGSMQKARMKRAAEVAAETPGGWYVCQHLNPLNPRAHSQYTAREIEAAFPQPPDALVVGVSTAGQLAGLVAYLKERFSKMAFVGVDVAGSAIFRTPRKPYKMTGLGLSFIPPAFQPQMLEEAYSIEDALAFSMCRELARREGLLLGASSGAIACAGLAFAARHPDRKRILLINPDRGDRYLETVYDDDWIAKQGLLLMTGRKLFETAADLTPVPRSVLTGEEEE